MKNINLIKVLCITGLSTLSAYTNANDLSWDISNLKDVAHKRVNLAQPVAQHAQSIRKISNQSIRDFLQDAPVENVEGFGLKTLLPLPTGEQVEFYLWESSILEDGFAQKYPNLKTYQGYQVGKPTNTGRFDLTEQGFHGMFRNNGDLVFVDPISEDHYKSYYKSDFMSSSYAKEQAKSFKCEVKGHQHRNNQITDLIGSDLAKSSIAEPIQLGDTLRTYRLAVATTGEYSKFHGDKAKSVASVVSAINRVNEVYQKDFSVKLVLVADNDKIVYDDPATDPFNGNDDGGVLVDESQAEIDKTIGTANYDVGHTFSTGGGGLAGLGVVCDASQKATGITGSGSPTGDPYWIDYVAHELGHQFNSEHSFNSCDGSGNRAGSWGYEPGSASTIMSYAGLCGDRNLQAHSDAYFHTTSIEQVKSHITGSADSCASKTSNNNAIPSVNAGSDYTIPKETPFKLTAVATDADSADNLTYVWEQRDLGATASSAAEMIDDGSRPIFRSWAPSSKATRFFPRLAEVLAGGALVKGEAYPTTTRKLNFVATVRDQKGGINSDATLINVIATAGPFKSKFPTSSSHWAPSSKQYSAWNVANTAAAPISCSTVNIKLSIDDGVTFSSLISDTPNDGQELLTLPATSSDKARFFIECSNQPFFAVSQNFKISSAGSSVTEQPPVAGNNNAPKAQADTYNVAKNAGATKQAVLSNDSDPDSGDNISIVKVSTPSNGGVVTIIENGKSINYTPAANYIGSETYNYTINDSSGAAAQATVTVIIQEVTNNAPTAQNDSYTLEHNSSNNSLSLLTNDSDPDSGDSIKITTVSAVSDNATVTVSSDEKSVSYTAVSGFSGDTTFSYTISDSKGLTAQASVTVSVKSAPVTPPNTGESGNSGGGCAGLFLIGLLALRRRFSKKGSY